MECSLAGTTAPWRHPGVHIETIHNPIRYTYAQIEQACKVAAALGAAS